MEPWDGCDRELGVGDWHALPESGWGLLVAYLAGPSRARVVVGGEVPPVRYQVVEPDGEVREWSAPRTPADDALVLEAINDYLAVVAVPPLPRLGRPFVRLPEGTTLSHLTAAIGRTEDRFPPVGPDPEANRPLVAALRLTIDDLLS